MAKERLKRVWRRLSGTAAVDVGSSMQVTLPPDTSPLPGVPAAVLEQWPDWVQRRTQEWAQVSQSPQQAHRFLVDALNAVVPFLDEVERSSEELWGDIEATVAIWWQQATAQMRAELPVETRVKVWLAATGQQDQLAVFCASRWFEHGWLPTEVVGTRVLAVLPEAVPEQLRELSPAETPLKVTVRGVRPTDSGWQLETYARISHVSMHHPPVLRVWLHQPHSPAAEIELPTPQLRNDPRANHGDLGGQRYQDFGPGAATVLVPYEALRAGSGPWQLRFELTVGEVTRNGTVSEVDRRGSARRGKSGNSTERLEFDADARLVLTRSAELPASQAAVLDAFEVQPDAVVVRGHWHAGIPPAARFRLVADSDNRVGPEIASQGERFEVTLPLTENRWGRTGQPLVEGRYWIRARSGEHEIPVVLGELAEQHALDWQDAPVPAADALQIRWVSVGTERTAGLMLRPALTPEERGPFHQWRLQQRALNSDEALQDDLVYLQCFTGRSATDSQLALRDEIRRSYPHLRVVWGVAEAASWTPTGDERVLIGSEQWYRTITTARYLSQNGDVDRWFRRRDGQRFLATFHGYPSKTMGIGMWAAKGYTPLRIEHELARTRDVWSLIITPTPQMDEFYRAQYDYDGPIAAVGLPRDDQLRATDASQVRATTRELLGIAEHETVVLYAPTWRDNTATDWRQAEAVLHLDIEQASRELGPDYVFLMRGHRFTQTPAMAGEPRMIDVTEYPEINDLILASDVAVLDYSSLRFDFSLTGRPMIFLVPDLAEYTGDVRGFLYDYLETTPGPLLNTVPEVVAALRDLPALSREYAQPYAAFEDRFNTFMDGHAAQRVAQAWLG